MMTKIHYVYLDCGTRIRTVTDRRKEVTCIKCKKLFKLIIKQKSWFG